MRTISSPSSVELMPPIVDQQEAPASRAFMLREMRYTGVLKHVAEDLAKIESRRDFEVLAIDPRTLY